MTMAEAPAAVRPAPPATRPHGGTRRRTAVLIAVAVLVVALAAVATVTGAAGLLQLRSAGPVVAGGTTVTELPDFGDRGAVVLLYEDGREVAYAFPVRNDGWLPMTVTGLDVGGSEDRPLLVPTTVGIAASSPVAETVDDLTAEPFEAFTLGPGESGMVVVHARMDNCEFYTERGLQLIRHHTADIRLAGIPSTRRFELADDVIVRSPSIQRCSDRLMDRSARQR
jgi:hypothetical protein